MTTRADIDFLDRTLEQMERGIRAAQQALVEEYFRRHGTAPYGAECVKGASDLELHMAFTLGPRPPRVEQVRLIAEATVAPASFGPDVRMTWFTRPILYTAWKHALPLENER